MKIWIVVGMLLALLIGVALLHARLQGKRRSRKAGEVPEEIGGWTIVAPLRTEGTTRLFEARNASGDVVVLKVLPQDALEDAAHRRRFEREVRAYVKIHHPNVCRVVDFSFGGGLDDPPYLAVEHVDGESLEDVLQRERALSVERALEIVRPLIKALGSLHDNGVVYRNLHPRNILLGKDGEVKLADFALARLDQNPELAATTTAMAEPQMLSPEQLTKGPQAVDSRSDLYAVGVLLYRMLIGRYPFDGTNTGLLLKEICENRVPALDAQNPAVPNALSRIVVRLMDRQPATRYATASLLFEALRGIEPKKSDPEAISAGGSDESPLAPSR